MPGRPSITLSGMDRCVAAEGTISQSGGLPGRYAAALYDLASERRELDAVVDQMDALGRLIDQSAPFRRLLSSPLVDVTQARTAAHAVLTEQGFGKTVATSSASSPTTGALPCCAPSSPRSATLVAQKRGVVTANVASAHPLSDVQREQLRARLIEAGYGNVNIQETVDASLLGGLVVRVGARLYDTSLKSRLQRLQYAMKGAA